MNATVHKCAIAECQRQIPVADPICARHREQLQDRKGGRKLIETIDHQYVRRQQCIRGAALKLAEAVSLATAMLHDVPPGKLS
jgi:hypothetical protein